MIKRKTKSATRLSIITKDTITVTRLAEDQRRGLTDRNAIADFVGENCRVTHARMLGIVRTQMVYGEHDGEYGG